MKNSFCIIASLFFLFGLYAQVDLNRCNVKQKQSFTVKQLKFKDSLFMQQSYSASTLYLSSNNSKAPITVLNSSPLGINKVAINDNNKLIALVDYDGTVKVIDHKTKTVTHQFNFKNRDVTAVSWYKNQLFIGLKKGEFKCIDILERTEHLIEAHNDAITQFKIINKTLYTTSLDGYVKKWNLGNLPSLESEVNLKEPLTTVDVSKNNSLIAVGTFNGNIRVIDNTLNIKSNIEEHKNIVSKIQFLDNDRLLSSSYDKTLIITNIQKGKSEVILREDDYIINFDISTQGFIYSVRNGTIVYKNLQCYSNKEFLTYLISFK